MIEGRLIQSRIIKLGGCDPCRVVLDVREGEYVTHVEVHPPDRPVHRIWGHYFQDDLEAAVRDFGERALKDIQQLLREARQRRDAA